MHTINLYPREEEAVKNGGSREVITEEKATVTQ
jgi:hypothetical protein